MPGPVPAPACMSVRLISNKANSYFSNWLPILKCSSKANRKQLKCQHFPEKEHKLSLDFLPTRNVDFSPQLIVPCMATDSRQSPTAELAYQAMPQIPWPVPSPPLTFSKRRDSAGEVLEAVPYNNGMIPTLSYYVQTLCNGRNKLQHQ